MKRCPYCSAHYADKAHYCRVDGHKLDDLYVAEAGVASPELIGKDAAAPAMVTQSGFAIKYCPMCGLQYPKLVIYCHKDGQPLCTERNDSAHLPTEQSDSVQSDSVHRWRIWFERTIEKFAFRPHVHIVTPLQLQPIVAGEPQTEVAKGAADTRAQSKPLAFHQEVPDVLESRKAIADTEPYSQNIIESSSIQPAPKSFTPLMSFPVEEEIFQRAATAAEATKDWLIGRTIAKHYRLIEKLGEGGMGVVYKAEHLNTGLSAIKILLPEYAYDLDLLKRFAREAEMSSRINHPHAVAIYDVGEEPDGLFYIAMEYIEGGELSRVIQREAPLPVERIARITRRVAAALHAAHQLDIVHRDLKPENIMICERSNDPDWVKVVDFGIAKAGRYR